MHYKAILEKDGFKIASKNSRYTKMLLGLGYELVDEAGPEDKKVKVEPEKIVIPEFEDITVEKIKKTLDEHGIEYESKESKTQLYAKLMRIEGTTKNE